MPKLAPKPTNKLDIQTSAANNNYRTVIASAKENDKSQKKS